MLLFLLTSDHATLDDRLPIMRHQWHIENRLHYVRDITLGEDACRVRHPWVQHSLAILNNLTLGLIRLGTDFPYIPQARHYLVANLFEVFQLIR